MEKEQKIEKVIDFKNYDKFSNEAWEERGLNPSDEVICSRLNSIFDKTAQELIDGLKAGVESKNQHEILKTNLNAIDHLDFDTEEREFICDLFFVLAEIIHADISSDLQNWMYGFDFPQPQIESTERTLSQICQGCGANLETFIQQTDPTVPDHCWFIIQCNKCKTHSLLDVGPGVKRLSFGNYKQIEMLLKSQFNILQANDKLNQLNK